MIINHNMGAINANRMMGVNQSNSSKSMEKLSSGLRINRAGDDAAGLAISEKMRGQIRGLDQASANSQDGISLIQTAEGALNETHSILQRMRELAVQSATDTNTADDRKKIQSEVDQLAKEITRISTTTEFNSQNLLNGGIQTGNVGELTFHVGANAGQNLSLGIGAMDAKTLGVSRDAITGTISAPNAAKLSSVDADNGIAMDDKLAAGTYRVTVTDTAAGVATFAQSNSATTVGSGFLTGPATADTNIVLKRTVGAPTAASVTKTYVAPSGASADLKFKIDGGAEKTATIADGADIDAAILAINSAAGSAIATKSGTSIVLTSGTTGTSSSVEITGAAGGFTVAAAVTGSAAGASTWEATGDKTGTASGSFIVNGVTVDMSKISGTMADNDTITISASKNATTTVQLTTDPVSGAATNIGSAVKIDKANGGTYTIGDTTTGKMIVSFDAGQATAATSKVTVAQTASEAATFANGQKSTDASVSGGIDVSTQKAANLAVTVINKAITTVSEERSKLGAYQNRLEHTIANLNTSSENLTSAESRIRDVNMAKEMSTFSKNNILTQAAQAMLAQAKSQPEQVLQLLR